MSFRTACANKFEREQMKNEYNPKHWLKVHREIRRDRIVEFVGGTVLVAMVVGMFMVWLKAEGVI